MGNRRGTGLQLLASAAVLFVLHVLAPFGTAGELSYDVLTVGAAGAAWLGAARQAGSARAARLVAIGLSLSAAADVLWSVLEATSTETPDVSLADPLWIASYVALGAGLSLMLLHSTGRRRADVDGLVDLGLIGVLGLLVVSPYITSSLTTSGVPVSTRAVWAAYPVLDAGLIALLVRLLCSPGARTRSGALLVIGAVGWMVSDIGYLLANGDESSGALLDAGWLIGAVLLAASTWFPGPVAPAAGEDGDVDAVGLGRVSLAILPLVAPAALAAIAEQRGAAPGAATSLAVTVALAGLALVRAVRLLRSSETAQRELAGRRAYYRALALHSSDAVMVLDAKGRMMHDSPNLGRLLGFTGVDATAVDVLDHIHPEDAGRASALFRSSLDRPGEVLAIELRVGHADGSLRWLSARAVNMLHEREVAGIVVHIHDVTARKQAEAELAHRASHDSLTDLPNRSLLTDRVAAALAEPGTTSEVALLYIDLDGFKHVNDTMGHEAGDVVLRDVAARLLRVVGQSGTVARMGGDEFAVLLPPGEHQRRAEHVADAVLERMQERITVGGWPVTVTASIGIARPRAGAGGANATALLRDADVAMYRAKTGGKNRRVTFEASDGPLRYVPARTAERFAPRALLRTAARTSRSDSATKNSATAIPATVADAAVSAW